MATFAAKMAIKMALGKQMKQHKDKDVCGENDPFFEEIVIKGKKKKVMRQIPDFIPVTDAKVLAKAKKRAYRLDMSFGNIFGVRFGLESLLGLIPEIGDLIGAFMAMSVFRTCRQIEGGLPLSITIKMLMNILFDFIVGLIPLLGDFLDAGFKCNTRNVKMLEDYLRDKHGPKDKTKKRLAGLHLFKDDEDYKECNGDVNYLLASEAERRQMENTPAVKPQNRWDDVADSAPEPVQDQKQSNRWSWRGRNEKQQDPERGTAQR